MRFDYQRFIIYFAFFIKIIDIKLASFKKPLYLCISNSGERLRYLFFYSNSNYLSNEKFS